MPKSLYLRKICLRKKDLIRKNMFHRTPEELREFHKENDIKLLKLLKYIGKRSNEKIQKENDSGLAKDSLKKGGLKT